MNIYISGISGTGMGPLALMAKQAGINVFGSDLHDGAVAPELANAKIEFKTGPQDGKFFKQKHDEVGIDWFVYTSALPKDHPELVAAEKLGIRISKRDELIAYLVEKLGLQMVAVAGTHGKTTTTSMIIWTCLQLGLPISYLVGTTLPYAVSGQYNPESKFLIYEADEYDRNFLHFSPWLSAITTVTYDHPDIYPTRKDYQKAFKKFEAQSENVFHGDFLSDINNQFTLPGAARRSDAALALRAVQEMAAEIDFDGDTSTERLIEILNQFPSSGRRFEKIGDGFYTDYAHHPEEVAATIAVALEEAAMRHLDGGVVVIYEPHQNTRQHEVIDGYTHAFDGVSKLFWLPTYLTREDPKLKVLQPQDFIEKLGDIDAVPAELNEELMNELHDLRESRHLILLMAAGPADSWLRKYFYGFQLGEAQARQ